MSVHDPLYQIFIERLVEAREGGQLTQVSVAKALKRPQSFVSKYESGERRLDISEFVRVCEVLNVRPARLIDDVIAAEVNGSQERK